MTDRELIWEYANGNLDTFHVFYGRYKDALYTFLHNRCREEAGDLFQETFVRFIDAAAQKEITNPKAYLFQIALNLIRNLGRKAKVISLSAEFDLPEPENEEEPVNEEVLKESLAELAKEKPLFYDVLHLHIFGEMTFEEIGKLKEMSKDTIASRYRYAIHYLRNILQNNFLETREVENV